MWRLNGSRNPDIRVFSTDLVDVADTEEHYRWLIRARMGDIAAWATDIIAGVRANRKANLR